MKKNSGMSPNQRILATAVVFAAGILVGGLTIYYSMAPRAGINLSSTAPAQTAGGAVTTPIQPKKYSGVVVKVTSAGLVVRPPVVVPGEAPLTLTVGRDTVIRAFVPKTAAEVTAEAGQTGAGAAAGGTEGTPQPLPTVDNPYKEEAMKLSDFKAGDLVEFVTTASPLQGEAIPVLSITWLSAAQASSTGGSAAPGETGGQPIAPPNP